jgi:hypothetical protein
VRDRSNYNNGFDNTFNATGGVAAYLDDFCDQQCVNTANPKKYRECASYGNRFAYNTIYTGTFWDLIPPGETNARRRPLLDPQRTGAPAHRGKQKLSARGDDREAVVRAMTARAG